MIEAIVLGPWGEADAGGVTGPVPRVAVDYPIVYYEDRTDQPAQNIPPAPNVFVHLIRCSSDVFAEIEAADYCTVLTCKEVR